jgi:hypothetical protein
MKYLFGFATLLLLSSVPVYAQRSSAGFGGGSGGSIGGGTSRLPTYPATNFQAVYVTGADNYNFSPSTFRSYDQAVKEGRAALTEHAKTVAEIAKESRNADRPKAKVTISQDASGRAVIESH